MSGAIATACGTPERRAAARPFVAVGIAAVVAGGFVAAATAPAPSEHGSWAAAYLVLVMGVAQVALGFGQALLAPQPPSRRLVTAEFATWNLGNAAVVAGTLLDTTPMVDAGGLALVAALALAIRAVRGCARLRQETGRRDLALHGFRALIAVLLVSIPVGLTLAQLRAG